VTRALVSGTGLLAGASRPYDYEKLPALHVFRLPRGGATVKPCANRLVIRDIRPG
jgi:hypothetical protein